MNSQQRGELATGPGGELRAGRRDALMQHAGSPLSCRVCRLCRKPIGTKPSSPDPARQASDWSKKHHRYVHTRCLDMTTERQRAALRNT